MQNFRYFLPTKMVFGKDTHKQVGEEIKNENGSRVLVLYGGKSAKKSGLLDVVFKSLQDVGMYYVELGGVVPNPRLSLIRKGIELCVTEKIDFILAVGGGSVIDSAKGIGIGVPGFPDIDVWDYYLGKRPVKECLPVGVVLTIAATGSETADGSVVTNEEGWLKRDVGVDCMRPRFAIMNPELTYTLPPYQTASGGTDILMHVMERYFTLAQDLELSDSFCEAIMKVVMHNIPRALAKADDYDARTQIMWAASVCHNGFLSIGRVGDWACHQLEHELSGLFDVTHGAGLAAIWGSWARYVYKTDINRFARFAVNVMGCPMDFFNPERTALEGIAAMETYLKSIGMPISVSQMGIELTDEQIETLATKCSNGGSGRVGNFVKLGYEDMKAIYTMAR